MSISLEGALVERDRELATIAAAVDDVRHGRGALLFVAGPAGHGKTALLRSLRQTASGAGIRMLTAVGAEIERDFPFGVVRQLFEPAIHSAGEARRGELFAGAAELARPVFDPAPRVDVEADTSFTRLHGLLWLATNLAADEPLVVIIDDLHWVDTPSLRFLDVLSRRLEDLPILVAAASRPSEPGAAQDLLDGLAAGPATQLLRPRALSEAGIGSLLSQAVDGEVEAAFVGAAAEMTAGSPLLLSELARALVEEGFTGGAHEVERLRRAVPSNLARSVVARLRRLAPNALAVARALAVLGERSRVADVAALAEVPPETVTEAHAALARVGLMDTRELRFLHPLVRQAVHADLVGSEQAQWHRRAAGIAARSGADAADVAAHVVLTEPAGEAWAAGALAVAGRRALAEGAPEVAVRFLQRALAEPPAEESRQSVVLALAQAEARMGLPQAAARLEEAAGGPDPRLAVQADRLLAQILVTQNRAADGAEVLRRSQAAALRFDPDLAQQIDDDLVDVLAQHESIPEEYASRLEKAESGAGVSPTLLSHLAFRRAITGAPVREVLDLVRRALTAPTGDESAGFVHFYAVEALMVVEAADEAAAALRNASALAKQFGSRVVAGPLTYMPSAWAAWERAFGDLGQAETLAREALDLMTAAGAETFSVSVRCTLGGVLLDRGRIDEADAVCARLPARETGPGLKEVHAHRGRLRFLQRRYDEALMELELELELEERRGWATDNRGTSRMTLVQTLAALGRTDEAVRIAQEQIATAQRRGVGGAEARARLSLAAALEPADAIEQLRSAAAAASRSPSLKLQAEVLLELGAALRRSGERAAARDPLTEARDLARRCGATGTEELAHQELIVAGARPQRVALAGVESLTAAERRVAELAAQGLKNRDIAEALFVTLKTVEVHLGRAYSKLDIKGRSQLAAALAGDG